MQRLLRGIEEFRRTHRAAYAKAFLELARGQRPDTLAIACSDSRISPLEFATTEPGDVFVVRNVGNLVPPYEEGPVPKASSAGAAIEYALAALQIEDIVVCGHSGCGAMNALLKHSIPSGTPHLADWLEYGRRTLEGLPAAPPGLDPADHLSQQNVLRQVENLRTYPAVRDGERAGRLHLSAWWFDIASAEVFDFDRAAGRFVPLDEARIARLIEERTVQDARRARRDGR